MAAPSNGSLGAVESYGHLAHAAFLDDQQSEDGSAQRREPQPRSQRVISPDMARGCTPTRVHHLPESFAACEGDRGSPPESQLECFAIAYVAP